MSRTRADLLREIDDLYAILGRIAGAVEISNTGFEVLPEAVAIMAAELNEWKKPQVGQCLITARITAPLQRMFTDASTAERAELVKRQTNELTSLLARDLPAVNGLVLQVQTFATGLESSATSFVFENHGWHTGEAA